MRHILKTIVRFEWITLWQSNFFGWAVGALAFFAAYALYYGHTKVERQMRVIDLMNQANDSTKAVVYDAFKNPAMTDSVRLGSSGRNSVRDAFSTEIFLADNVAVNQPNRLSHLSIGQRDIYPIYRKVSARSLYNDDGNGVSLDDKYVDTSNPHTLLVGNFDLSFVFIFLFPLFIIALTFNIVSHEVENGTYPLIRILPVSPKLIFATKFLFRLALLWGLSLVFSSIGFLISPLEAPLDLSYYLHWLAVISAYILFWFALAWVVVSFRQSSQSNALVLVGCWLLFLIVIPALVNSYVASNFKIDSRTVLIDEINDLSSKIWDMPESETVETYYKEYPQYRKNPPQLLWSTTEDNYDDLDKDKELVQRYNKKILVWHYYLNKMIAKEVESYNRQVVAKQRASERFSFINPAGVAYETLSELAASGFRHQDRFRSATAEYRDAIFERSNKLLFEEQKMTLEDYKAYPEFSIDQFSPHPSLSFGVALFLTLVALVGSVVGLVVSRY